MHACICCNKAMHYLANVVVLPYLKTRSTKYTYRPRKLDEIVEDIVFIKKVNKCLTRGLPNELKMLLICGNRNFLGF